MQQITVYIDGQYISFVTIVHQIKSLQNRNQKIILFKITGFKKNNVQKYYNDLQRMISKIQHQRKQLKNQKKKKNTQYTTTKSLKKDYFKVFLNPKRVKKILQQQQQNQQLHQTNQFQRLDAINDFEKQKIKNFKQRVQRNSMIADQQKIIDYRKKLALNAQFQIKNQRAKYNIWKIKKVLFDQGILSRYTYNMLVGKGNDFQTLKNFAKYQQKTQNNLGTMVNYQTKKQVEKQQMSQDQLMSQDMTNQPEVQKADKPNDNQTFNSASSSAAFISMTNSIKMFKIKLRSLNTPKLLYWLNVSLILVILLITFFGVWLWIVQNSNMNLGAKYFQKAIQSTWAIDSLLMGKLATIKQIQITQYKSSFTTDFYTQNMQYLKARQNQYLNLCHEILSIQLLQYAELQKLDSSLLKYLFVDIPLIQTYDPFSSIQYLQTLQFIMRQQDILNKIQILEIQKKISYLLRLHKQTFGDNLYYNKLSKIDLILFLTGLLIFFIMLLITIPIVYKIQSKVQQIMQLVSKISLNQRRRYYLQFNILNQQLQNLSQTDSWAQIQQLQQNKMRKVNLKNTFSQLEQSTQSVKQSKNSGIEVTYEKKKIKSKFYQTIYFKIIVIYTIFLLVYITKFVDLKLKFNKFQVQNQIFTNILIQKLASTQQGLVFNQFLTDSNLTGISLQTTKLVDDIYQSFHLDLMKGSYYQEFIQNITTSNVCQKINQELLKINDSTSYLKGFLLDKNQMLTCQSIQNGTLTKGLFSSYDFMQQKRLYTFQKPLLQRINYIQSQTSINVYKMQYYTNTAGYIIQRILKQQSLKSKINLTFHMGAWLIVLSAFLLFFTIVWIFIYLNIAQKASYINAFLLLIPYDVLSQNPYIKLYIKNQFDYKSSVY